MWGRIKTSMSSLPRRPLSPDHKQTENNLWKQQAGQSGLVFKFLTVVGILGQDAACLHVNRKTETSVVQNPMPDVCHISSLLWIKELLSNWCWCWYGLLITESGLTGATLNVMHTSRVTHHMGGTQIVFLVFKQLVNINVLKMGKSLQLTLMFLCRKIRNHYLQFICIASATVHSPLHSIYITHISVLPEWSPQFVFLLNDHLLSTSS